MALCAATMLISHREASLNSLAFRPLHQKSFHTFNEFNESEMQALCVRYIPYSNGNLVVGTMSGVWILHRSGWSLTEMQWGVMSMDAGTQTIIDCVDCHPKGGSIIVAGPSIAGFRFYKLANHGCRHVRKAFERVTDLQFSPCGNYIMTGPLSSLHFLQKRQFA